MASQQLRFPPFRLDVVNNLLWREGHQIPLRPKTLAVLRVLVEKSGQVVSREELFQTVWGGTIVSDNVLKVCISEIREALGDDRTKPRFIETLPKQGYRFIAPLNTTQPVVSRKEGTGDLGLGTKSSPQAPSLQPLAPSLVGREAELAQLTACWQRALNGERQIIFVTGEPGIGKTALLDVFVSGVQGPASNLVPRLQPLAPVFVGRGQCVEHYGAGEAYLPVLEALEQSAHSPAREQITALLNQYAPLWLAQMPALLPVAERERLQRELQGVTQERMLREMATFLEMLTAETPLVVVLEDLHWSDTATLTLLSAVARRRQPARLLVIGTYRPTDLTDQQSLLPNIVNELRLHHQCQEFALSLLKEEAVAAYILERFTGQTLPAGLADVIYQQTDGNPLFMVNLVDHILSQQATLPQVALPTAVPPTLGQLPESLQQMLTYQIERLKVPERQMLEAASVAGMEFSAAIIAAALGNDALAVEQRCDSLVQRQVFLRRLPVIATGLASEGNTYTFRHALLHSLFYDRVGILRRQQMHQSIGERKEQMAQTSGSEMSAELAAHFMASGDAQRSVTYLQQAARTALRRSAHLEARTHLANALEGLMRLPDDELRTKRELELQLMHGVTLMSTQGFSSPQVQQTYARAHQLCQQLGSTPQLFPALWGLRSFYHVRAEYHIASDIAAQLLHIAESIRT